MHWQHSLSEKWPSLHFRNVNVESDGTAHRFDVDVDLDGLDPDFVRVELYADSSAEQESVCRLMTRLKSGSESGRFHRYQATVAANRPSSDFTARLIPHHDGVSIPLEVQSILWQR